MFIIFNNHPISIDCSSIQKWIFKQRCQWKRTMMILAYHMEDHLTIICQFADTITNTIKRFAELCREEKRRRDAGASEFAELQNELIKERKKRIELEELVRKTGSSLEDPSLAEFINNSQERKRPKTAFLLFFAEYREKVMRENPTLTLARATSLAKIKWDTLKKQQQEVYQKKLADMNKLYLQRRSAQSNLNNGDSYLVKREFQAENEEEKENDGYQNQEEGQDGLRRASNQNEGQNNQIVPNTQANLLQSTMMASIAEEPTVFNNQEPPREKCALEIILDLFHTQQNNPPEQRQPPQIIPNDISMARQAMEEEPMVPASNVDNTPSLVMIDPATGNNPIVIPPTVQE